MDRYLIGILIVAFNLLERSKDFIALNFVNLQVTPLLISHKIFLNYFIDAELYKIIEWFTKNYIYIYIIDRAFK